MVTLYVDENIIVLGRTDKKDEAEEGKLRLCCYNLTCLSLFLPQPELPYKFHMHLKPNVLNIRLKKHTNVKATYIYRIPTHSTISLAIKLSKTLSGGSVMIQQRTT